MRKYLILALALIIIAPATVMAEGWPFVPQPDGSITPVGDKPISGSSQSGLVVVSDGDGIVLTSSDWGKLIWMTGAGLVGLPNAGASDIGKYIVVGVRDVSEQVSVYPTDATELIVLTDGTATDAGDESDMSTSKSSRTTFVYMETGKWYSFGSSTTDGGAHSY